MVSAYQPAGYPILTTHYLIELSQARAKQLRGYARMQDHLSKNSRDTTEAANALDKKVATLRGKLE